MSKPWFEVQSIIVEKATRDEQYRRRLLEDPIRVAEEEHGGKLPASVRIKVIEFDPETRYILLRPRSAQGELPDSAVEQAAAGA